MIIIIWILFLIDIRIFKRFIKNLDYNQYFGLRELGGFDFEDLFGIVNDSDIWQRGDVFEFV